MLKPISLFSLGLALSLLLGCKGGWATFGRTKGKEDPKTASTNAPSLKIQPAPVLTGRVVLVNAPLKYVVVEGVQGRLPAADQRMNVYREGQKVGEILVSNQNRGANFAADITLGEVKVGDTVRVD